VTRNELLEALEKLPSHGPSSSYPRFTWERRRAELIERVRDSDTTKFLTWPMMAEAFFVGDAPWVQNEIFSLLNKDWKRWQRGIKETTFGAPARMASYSDTSGQMAHQAYILKQWEDAADKKVEDLRTIFEFGGGYGSMARLCWQLGFGGAYLIHDLPEFLLLQQYYLTETGVTNAIFCQDYRPLGGMEFDLFIAACSLSEVPFEVRDEVLSTIKAKGYLFLYQSNYMGKDNHAYFQQFAESKDMNWENYHVPHWMQHQYLVGT